MAKAIRTSATVRDTRSTASTKAVPPHAKTKTAQAVPTQPTIGERFSAEFDQLMSKYGAGVPSGTRIVVSLIASLCLGGAIGYFGGSLLGYAMVGALMLTGSAFIAWAIYILGVIALIYAGWKAGGWVGDYILNRKVDAHAEAVGTWFKAKRLAAADWIGSRDVPLAERVA